MQLVTDIYKLTKNLPKEELYGLSSQIKRASTSIVTNTSEGFGRYTYPDKANKYTIARGECTETDTLIRVAMRLGFLSEPHGEKLLEQTNEIGRMLSGLIKSSKKRS